MNYQTALKTLGLSHPPTPAEVKKSYRQLALRYHPDRNANDPKASTLFRECTEAYNYMLENVTQWVDVDGGVNRGDQKTASQRQAVAVEDLENIFDDIFGFTREDRILGYQQPQLLPLTLIELAFGVTKEVRLNAFEKCGACQGSGAGGGTHALICTHCFGSGRIKSVVEGETSLKVCPKCVGRGRSIRQRCSVCNGFGRSEKFRKQKINIPAGLLPQEIYTLHSTDVKTGEEYDLFISPQLISHKLFAVEKCDLLCEYPIDEVMSKQGGVVEIPTLWGWTSFKVPQASKTGSVFTIAGFGLPLAPGQKQKGNLKVKGRLVPENFFRKESLKFLKQVSMGNKNYPASPRSFWNRLFGL